jgi:hypothetical protein
VIQLEENFIRQARQASVPEKFERYIKQLRRKMTVAFSIQFVTVFLIFAIFVLNVLIGNFHGPERVPLHYPVLMLGYLTLVVYWLMSYLAYYNKVKKIHLYFEDYHHGKDFVWPIEDVLDPKKKWGIYRVWDISDYYVVQLLYLNKIWFLTDRYVLYLPKQYLSDEEKTQLDIIYKKGIN